MNQAYFQYSSIKGLGTSKPILDINFDKKKKNAIGLNLKGSLYKIQALYLHFYAINNILMITYNGVFFSIN